jgi:hypothetical protein
MKKFTDTFNTIVRHAITYTAISLSCAALISTTAFAQDKKPDAAAPSATPATTPAPAASTPSAAPVNTPKHSCVAPPDPGILKNEAAAQQLRKDMDVYRTCLSNYATEMRRIAEGHVAAGNAAIDEFNVYAKGVTEKQAERTKAAEAEKQKEKEKK